MHMLVDSGWLKALHDQEQRLQAPPAVLEALVRAVTALEIKEPHPPSPDTAHPTSPSTDALGRRRREELLARRRERRTGEGPQH